MAAGRPSKYDSRYCEMLVEHMSGGASITSFAAEIDVSRSTITEWADNHPEFSVAVTRGKAKCAAWWERVARNNALTGNGNATLTIFGLSNMASCDWKQKQEIDHKSTDSSMTPKPALDMSKLSTEALAEIMRAADETNQQ
jgi:hypothetical protein